MKYILFCDSQLEVGDDPGLGVEITDFETGGGGAALLEGEGLAPDPRDFLA